jgi:hypothetical protein
MRRQEEGTLRDAVILHVEGTGRLTGVTGQLMAKKASGLSNRPSNVSSQDVLYRVAGVPGGLKTPG